jgi:DNA polymerase-3 subunit delta
MSAMYSELFGLLKESGGAFTGRSWGDAVKAWTRAVEHWSSQDLEHAIELLLIADAALKESRLSSDEQLLSTLILSLCGDATHSIAA